MVLEGVLEVESADGEADCGSCYASAMESAHPETPAERLRITFALIETAERMLRARLRRESPQMSEQAVEERVAAWYAKRPGAELGDAMGIPASWPRR